MTSSAEERLYKLLDSLDNSTNEEAKAMLNDLPPNFDINWKRWNGFSILHMACICQCPEIVKSLLSHSNLNPNLRNRYGEAPLHFVCYSNVHFESLQLLLEDHRVDINVADNDGNTILTIAAKYGNIKVIETMLASMKHIDHLIPMAIERARGGNQNDVVKLLESYQTQPFSTVKQLRVKLNLQGNLHPFSSFSYPFNEIRI